MLNFLFVLFLHLLNLFKVDITAIGQLSRLLLFLLLISFLLFFAKQFDILYEWCNWILLSSFLLLSNTLIHGVHQKHRVLDFRLDDWPQLLNE